MDAEGGQVIRRDRSSRRLAVVVVAQNVLVVACLIVTSYVYWETKIKSVPYEDNVHIQVDSVTNINGVNGPLELFHVHSNYMMSRHDNWILVSCTGPYLVYLDICYTNTTDHGNRGVLELKVRTDAAVLNSFTLLATRETCRGLHNTTYLREGQEVGVQLILSPGFKIKTATLGFSFLGGHCELEGGGAKP